MSDSEIEHARRVLQVAQGEVMDGLRKAHARHERARQRLAEAEAEVKALCLRGKEVGVPVTAMAETIKETRQMVYELIRRAERGRELREQEGRED